MQARVLAIFHGFAAGDADRVALDLDLEVRFSDPRHLRDDDEVVAPAEHVEGRVGTAAARARTQPAAGAEGIQRLLELQQGIYRVEKQHSHVSLLRWCCRLAEPGARTIG